MITSEGLVRTSKHIIQPGDFGYVSGLDFPENDENLSYYFLDRSSRDSLVLNVLRTIEFGGLSKTKEKDRWDKGWGENLEEYRSTGEEAALIPRYLLRESQPVRIHGDFAVSDNRLIELTFYRLYREAVFETYFNHDEISTIYEFGCGSGHNLIALAKKFPDKHIIGLDWSEPSVEISRELSKKYPNISGFQFDFFHPRDIFFNASTSAILTVGALEQTDGEYPVFIDWLIDQEPLLVVNIEPQINWYNPNSLIDYLGIRFLQVRQYWSGFPMYMNHKQADNEVFVIDRERVRFGSLFVEGYSRFVWSTPKHAGKETTSFNLL